jgi:hypothetical protein
MKWQDAVAESRKQEAGGRRQEAREKPQKSAEKEAKGLLRLELQGG